MRISCSALQRRPVRPVGQMGPVGPMKPVIQQKMPNVASSSLPDAPDRDLHEPRDQRCRWGLKPSARSGPEKRKERTEIRIAIAIVAFGVGRNHHAQGLGCHWSEPRRKAKKSEPLWSVRPFIPGGPVFGKKKVFCFFYFSKKMFSFGRFVFLWFFVFLFFCFCVFVFLCF